MDHSDSDGYFGDECGEISKALHILMDSWTEGLDDPDYLKIEQLYVIFNEASSFHGYVHIS